MRTPFRAAIALLLAIATMGLPSSANAEVWDDDGGMVFWGSGYSEPTKYEDAFNALDGRTLTQIAGTDRHICGIDEQGEAVCWGEGYQGRLGTGAKGFPPSGPSAVSTADALDGVTLVDVDAGVDFSCALDDNGHAYCWGNGRQGQLGRNALVEYTPVKVNQRKLHDDGFVDITAGYRFACGITSQGDAYCWGENGSGQLGTGDRKEDRGARRVKPGDIGDRRLVDIDAGWQHTCATDAAGRAYCWGEGAANRLGTGGAQDRLLPTRVVDSGPEDHPFTDISAGGLQTCARTDHGRLFCWGGNKFHEASPDRNWQIKEPRRVDVEHVSDFSAGTRHTCAVVEGSDIYCWGYNGSGQIGDGTKHTAKEPTPIKSPGDGLFGTEPEVVVARYTETCALDAAGDAYCWGGYPNRTPAPVPDEPTGYDGMTFTGVTNSGFHWCAMATTTQPVCEMEPIKTAGTFDGDPVHSLDTGGAASCALSDDGLAYCWGTGPLGNEHMYYSKNPVAVDTSGALAGRTLVDISLDEHHACAVDDTGKAFCWGEQNIAGEQGTGQRRPSEVPVAVKDDGALAGETLVAIETSFWNTCALSADGEVFCWGAWLGNGSGSSSLVPKKTDLSALNPGETVVSLHSGYDTPCLITDAGNAYCWGQSANGQTGTGVVGKTLSKPKPVYQDDALEGVKLTDLVMPEYYAMCGLGDNGRVYCWGEDQDGVLGNGEPHGRSAYPLAVVRNSALAGATVTDLGARHHQIWAVTEEAP